MNLRKLYFVITGVSGLLAAAAVGFLLFHGVYAEKYRDAKASGGEVVRPLDWFGVHSSRPSYLTVLGRTYRAVRGTPPYYIAVPSLASILFVTEGPSHQVTYHLVNLTTKEHIEFDGGTSGFGGHIGAPRKSGEPFTDYVESVVSNRLTLVKCTTSWIEKTVLNLRTHKIESEETINLEPNSAKTVGKGPTNEDLSQRKDPASRIHLGGSNSYTGSRDN